MANEARAKWPEEFREHRGLRELWREFGRIKVEIHCPFCEDDVEAYLWSLAGSGKRCPCGALLTQVGAWKRKDTSAVQSLNC